MHNVRMIFRTFVAACLIWSGSVGLLQAQSSRASANSSTNTPGYDIAKYTNTVTVLPTDKSGKIAQLAIKAFESYHFGRAKFRDGLSEKAFDRYLDAMDPQRIYFLEPDYQEFLPFRDTIDDRVLGQRDVQPVYDIFNRWLKRFDQSYLYVTALIKQDTFDFSGDERVILQRKELPRPKDLAEAQVLWRERVRSEYLNERLADPDLKPTLRIIADAFRSDRLTDLPTLLTNKMSLEKAQGLAELAKSAGNADKAVAVIETRLKTERTEEIRNNLTRRYNRTLRFLKQYDSEEVLQMFLDSVGHAFDPHSDYFSKKELDNFSIQMNLALFGIGATLQDRDGYTTIFNIVTNSPAQKSGLIRTNDRIIAIAQDGEPPVPVVDEKLSKVVDMIRGPKGTKVHLTIWPGNTDPSVRKHVTLVRDEVKLEDSEAKAQLVEVASNSGRTTRLGVIDLPSFYTSFPVGSNGRATTPKSTTGDVSKLLKKLLAEGAEGIVLDLRRNGGGSLEESVRLTGLFIKFGPVVQVKSFDGRVSQDSDKDDSILYDGPLVVLTSRFSASASEIVAGALQDYGRALLVGDSSTHGKGTVQTVQELGGFLSNEDMNPGAVKVTIRKFYRPSGSSTQLKGVIPDIVLPGINSHLETGEASLTNALPWDTIASARFDKVDRVVPYLMGLREKSEARVAAGKYWDWVREDVVRFRKQQAEKSVSLNLTERQKERADDLARQKTRKRELRQHPAVEPKVWDLTVKMADREGLPAAQAESTNTVAGVKGPAAADDNLPDDPAAGSGDDDEEAAPVVRGPGSMPDITLREAERILLDYLEVMAGRKKDTALKP